MNTQRDLSRLELFLYNKEQHSDQEKAGAIQAFEFTFENFWKLLQKLAAIEGLSVASPKKAFSFGFASGFLNDETLWLDMLKDRILTMHTHNEAAVEAIYIKTTQAYAPALKTALPLIANELETISQIK